jgi:hypothetical protein
LWVDALGCQGEDVSSFVETVEHIRWSVIEKLAEQESDDQDIKIAPPASISVALLSCNHGAAALIVIRADLHDLL